MEREHPGNSEEVQLLFLLILGMSLQRGQCINHRIIFYMNNDEFH